MHAHIRSAMVALAAVLAVGFSAGCGGGASTEATASNSPSGTPQGGDVAATSAQSPTVQAGTAAGPVVLPVQANSPPGEVVSAFLNAMRDGNSGIAAELLTEQARSETKKHQWPVQPPGAPSATYQIGNATYVDASQSGVHVPCLWTEPDGAGGAVQFEVIWALRQSSQGWRVAGFATEVVSGKPPYFFNFEDIGNLKETQAAAEAAMAELAAGQEAAAGEVANRPTANQLNR